MDWSDDRPVRDPCSMPTSSAEWWSDFVVAVPRGEIWPSTPWGSVSRSLNASRSKDNNRVSPIATASAERARGRAVPVHRTLHHRRPGRPLDRRPQLRCRRREQHETIPYITPTRKSVAFTQTVFIAIPSFVRFGECVLSQFLGDESVCDKQCGRSTSRGNLVTSKGLEIHARSHV